MKNGSPFVCFHLQNVKDIKSIFCSIVMCHEQHAFLSFHVKIKTILQNDIVF